MKKQLIICIFILTFFFPCTNGFSGVLEDLRNFEKSLGDWVTAISDLNKRLSNLESELEARDKQTADFNQSIANIENLIADLNAKVEKIERTGSVSGVKSAIKSFEGTLNVFKERFSQMAKKLEDQEVKTAVLERIYKTAQKPLETLMQAIDEQQGIINNLVEKLDNQEKVILAMQENLKKQASHEFLTSGIEELNARLSKLESGVLVQKTEEITEKEPEAKIKEKVVLSEASTEEAKIPTEEVSEMKGFIDIGGGFFIKNLKLKPFGSSTYISGEIMNKSDRDYSIADFKVLAYNEEDVILGGHGFSVKGFKINSTKTFEEIIAGAETKKIAKYSIFSTETPLVSDTGEITIKMIERKLQVAKAETKEAAPKDLEELIFDEGKRGTPEELKGFEDIGGGFYAGKVSFTSFGTSSTVTGEIKNNSKNDFYLASFVMKVYSKNFGMITSFDFSVRRLKSGDTKTFEEIISGVSPIDIARYDIMFKSSY